MEMPCIRLSVRLRVLLLKESSECRNFVPEFLRKKSCLGESDFCLYRPVINPTLHETQIQLH
jgi:hypothetical protein